MVLGFYPVQSHNFGLVAAVPKIPCRILVFGCAVARGWLAIVLDNYMDVYQLFALRGEEGSPQEMFKRVTALISEVLLLRHVPQKAEIPRLHKCWKAYSATSWG